MPGASCFTTQGRRMQFGLIAVLVLALLCGRRLAAASQPPPGVPGVMHECEGSLCSAWTWDDGHFDAHWPNGAIATLTVQSFTAQSVVINRTDTSNSSTAGLTAVYTGQISSQGDSIVDGHVTWTWRGFPKGEANGTWTATWTAVVAPPPAGTLTFTNPYATVVGNTAALSPINLDAAAAAPTATAISADGISAAVVVYTSSSADPVTFSADSGDNGSLIDSYALTFFQYDPNYLSPGFSPTKQTGAITPLCSVQVCTALALVWPPAQLPVSPALEASFESVTAHITARQGTTSVQGALTVYPPPLLLVHGIWSSAIAAGFSPYSNPSGFFKFISGQYPHSFIYDVNYGPVSYKAFDDPEVQAAFTFSLTAAMTFPNVGHGVVARTVDVVAHSMGALVTRWFLLDPADAVPYLHLPANPVHKLITIGTPHLGSNLATTLWTDQSNVIQIPTDFVPGQLGTALTLIEDLCLLSKAIGSNSCSLRNVLGLIGKKVDTGVLSLEGPDPLSNELDILADPASPPMSSTFSAIVGEAPDCSLLGLHIPGPSEALLNALIGLFAPGDSVAGLLGPLNDTIVPVTSQLDAPAQLPLARDTALVSSVVHTAISPIGYPFGFCKETGETASPNVWNQALYWLEGGTGPAPGYAQPVASAAETGSAPRTSASTGAAPLFDLTGYTSVSDSAISFSPPSNSNLTVNSAVNIVAASPSKTITQILLVQNVADPVDAPLYYVTQAPFSIPYTPVRLGTANFVAFALFSDMTYTATTLTYNLQTSGTASALQLAGAPAGSVIVGSSFVARALATFPNGPVDVTQSATYTTASGDAAVLSVGSGNQIAVTGPGTETLDVTYGPLKTSAKITAACMFTLTPANQIVPSAGGTVQIQVATEEGCPWTAGITRPGAIPTSQSGTGNGSVAVTVPANSSLAPQTVTILLGAQSAVVTQPYTPCSYTVSPAQISAPPSGASGTIQVTVPEFCPLIAASDAPWVTASIVGSSVSYTVAPNLTLSPRTANLIVAAQSIPVTQSSLLASNGPVILAAGGVLNGASFMDGLASGAWISIFGTNLSSTTRTWQSSDFQGNNLPTSVEGVAVNINGVAAYVEYVSPTQINVLAPGDPATGPVTVQVTNSLGASPSVTVNKQPFAPAFFAYSQQAGRYAIAEEGGTYALIAPAGLFGAGVSLQQAKPGDTILLYATGLGQTNPAYPEGQLIQSPAQLAAQFQVQFGGVTAQVPFAGIVGPGLYQINLVVPSLPPGDAALNLVVGGVTAPQVFIPIAAP